MPTNLQCHLHQPETWNQSIKPESLWGGSEDVILKKKMYMHVHMHICAHATARTLRSKDNFGWISSASTILFPGPVWAGAFNCWAISPASYSSSLLCLASPEAAEKGFLWVLPSLSVKTIHAAYDLSEGVHEVGQEQGREQQWWGGGGASATVGKLESLIWLWEQGKAGLPWHVVHS